ncbi:MAG: glycine--tRNA ligase subunit beta [Desulfovibrionaceae bacterium]|nr:glycine--tRNA ligase subunit beta [Desulfovibrionaceae bacterium]
MADFILEIGTEEIPSRFLTGMEEDLVQAWKKTLDEHVLEYEMLEAASTPRRAVISIKGLAEIQRESEEIVLGPPLRVAYGADGAPTKAAEGFARTQGVKLEDLFTEKNEKGEYLAARIRKGGRKASDILAEVAPQIISGLSFPKRMRWGSSSFQYARPIHWIVALLDDQVVEFSVAGIKSGRHTRGHRVHSSGEILIPAASDYFKAIAEEGAVTLRSCERRRIICEQGDALAAALGGRVLWNDDLLTEVQGLCEHPVPIIGDIQPKYLELPREVLLTSMETHQKCFGLEDENGRLLPHFLTVLNIDPKNMQTVKQGWERVLTARLEDARFFWETDLAVPFDDWLAALDDVIFLAPLGSMGNKTRRLEQLAHFVAEKVNHPEPDQMKRAGRLSKADLVSGMVGEFASLQGIMGGIYADKKGESDWVAWALREQYMPAGPETPAPTTLCGGVLSMADKLDTLAGCFGLNMIPTGAADPYALRRAALGIIRIALQFNWRFDLKELLSRAQSLYGDVNWKLSPEDALQKLLEFVNLRLKNYFTSQKGYDVVLVEAALGAGASDIWAANARLEALAEFAGRSEFEAAVLTFKRAANIVRKLSPEDASRINGIFKHELLAEEADKALAAKLEELAPRFDSMWKEDRFAEMFDLILELRPSVDAFFDQVMVMSDDLAVRENRLNLLKRLVDCLSGLADFSALQI